MYYPCVRESWVHIYIYIIPRKNLLAALLQELLESEGQVVRAQITLECVARHIDFQLVCPDVGRAHGDGDGQLVLSDGEEGRNHRAARVGQQEHGDDRQHHRPSASALCESRMDGEATRRVRCYGAGFVQVQVY